MAPDPVAAYLSEVERRCAYVKASARSGLGADEAARNSADDVPRLLKVAEAVLAFCAVHEKVPGVFTVADVDIPPSEIRRVVAHALLGEENPDA